MKQYFTLFLFIIFYWISTKNLTIKANAILQLLRKEEIHSYCKITTNSTFYVFFKLTNTLKQIERNEKAKVKYKIQL